jgi:beta-N-acetylhexosaminidase
LTVIVIGLAVVTAATSATAVVVAVRRDDKPQASRVDTGITTTAPPSLGTDSTLPPGTSTSASTGAPATAAPTSTATTGGVRQCAQLQALPLRAKLAQLLFVGVSDAASARAALGGTNPAGGVLVLGRSSTWFANGVLKGIAAGARTPPVVAADEEGGRVQRIDAVAGRMPSAYEMGQMPPARVRAIAKERGDRMRELGFTMDFAPVVDLYDKSNAVINDRAFSAEPQKVTAYAREFAGGLAEARITPVIKHFPGHGRSSGDSHKQSVTTPSLEELRKADLKPFVDLAPTIPAVMVGHLDVPGYTAPGRPTSVSPKAIGELLRKEIGFRGLVITDDLSGMKAITDRFSVPEAVVTSIAAGADVAIVSFPAGQSLDPLLAAMEKAVQANRLPMSRVDDALNHLGTVKPGCG